MPKRASSVNLLHKSCTKAAQKMMVKLTPGAWNLQMILTEV